MSMIEIHLDFEVNVNVKISNTELSSNGSSSKIICVLIKQEGKNTSAVTPVPTINTTSASNNVTTVSSTNAQLTNTTAQPFTTDSWWANTTTGFSTWPSNTTVTWFPNVTDLTTIAPDNGSNATDPWWLDWWLQGSGNSSTVDNGTLLDGYF